MSGTPEDAAKKVAEALAKSLEHYIGEPQPDEFEAKVFGRPAQFRRIKEDVYEVTYELPLRNHKVPLTIVLEEE